MSRITGPEVDLSEARVTEPRHSEQKSAHTGCHVTEEAHKTPLVHIITHGLPNAERRALSTVGGWAWVTPSPQSRGNHTKSKPHTAAKTPSSLGTRLGLADLTHTLKLLSESYTHGHWEERDGGSHPHEALTLPREQHPRVPTPRPILTLITSFG